MPPLKVMTSPFSSASLPFMPASPTKARPSRLAVCAKSAGDRTRLAPRTPAASVARASERFMAISVGVVASGQYRRAPCPAARGPASRPVFGPAFRPGTGVPRAPCSRDAQRLGSPARSRNTQSCVTEDGLNAVSPEIYADPPMRAGLRRVQVPVVRASDETLRGYGCLVDDAHGFPIEIVTWPLSGWRAMDPGTGNEGGTTV